MIGVGSKVVNNYMTMCIQVNKIRYLQIVW